MRTYTYTIQGTLLGSIQHEDWVEDISAEQLMDYYNEISALFYKDEDFVPEQEYVYNWRRQGDNLAKYLYKYSDVDKLIYNVVTNIRVGIKQINNKLYSWTTVTAIKKLTEKEKDALITFLSGQFSDGFGEELEQVPFTSFRHYYTYTDTDYTGMCYEYETYYDVDLFLHLWQENYAYTNEEYLKFVEQHVNVEHIHYNYF